MTPKESTQTLSYIVSSEQKKADCLLAAYDAWGTQAHVAGLGKIGVMNDDEVKKILEVLEDIKTKAAQGNFPYDPSLGAQLTLEKLITEQVGTETGGKVHTGRSRNDQVTTTQKLFVRDQVLLSLTNIGQLVEQLLKLSAEHIETVMPGYTHMQPAKPTTFGQWCLADADMLLRDAMRLQQTYNLHNRSPLGSAESYGTSWPLDRQYVAQLLAFDSVHEVPLDAIGNRGEFEVELLSDFSLLMLHCSHLAQDLLMMNTFESGQIALGEQTAERMGKLTGSSIMPQKKNPDILELVRANTSIVYGQLFQGLEVLKALPMGYNRDSRETKELIMTGLKRTNETFLQLTNLLGNLQINEEKMMQLVQDNYSLATDLADYLAQKFDLPYRTVYKLVGTLVKELIAEEKKLYETTPQMLIDLYEKIKTGSASPLSQPSAISQEDIDQALDPVKAIQRRKHIGGACKNEMNRMLQNREEQVESLHAWIQKKENKINEAKKKIDILIAHL